MSRPTACQWSQPVCWRSTSWCDTSEITGIPTTRERCDKVASYCDTRTQQCRGTRIAYDSPNPCVDWGTMASDPRCLPVPLACALERSFTLYFNLLFYAALAWAACGGGAGRAAWRGAAAHVLPFWATAQYIVWCTRIWRKCSVPPHPVWQVACSDFILHWVPLIIVIVAHVYDPTLLRVPPAWTGVLAVVALALLYLGYAWHATRGHVMAMYDVPLSHLLAIYLPLLVIAYVTMAYQSSS